MMDIYSEKCVIRCLLICKHHEFIFAQTQMTVTLRGSLIIEDHYPRLGPWLTKISLWDA